MEVDHDQGEKKRKSQSSWADMASPSRRNTSALGHTSSLGEERIPLSFKVIKEPELGATRPAGTPGEDFRANRTVRLR